MNKPISFALALGSAVGLVGAGCFGGNPNQNSQLANRDGSSSAGGSSGNVADASTPVTGTPLATFDTNLSGFILNMYKDSGSQLDLGDPASGVTPMMTFDASDGSPSPGSIQIVAPFFGANQYVDIQNTGQFGLSNLQNWSGGTLHVRVRLISGSFTGGVQLYVDTGVNSTGALAYSFGGTFTNFGKGSEWQEFVMSVGSPMSFGVQTTYDATKVSAYGLQLNTGSAGTNAGPATFEIDSFSISGVASATGGGGASGGGAGGTSGAAGAGGASGAAGATGTAGAGGGMPGPTQP
jgi:collagen type I/II/III/V/XI/XXIV/XXVII alpha